MSQIIQLSVENESTTENSPAEVEARITDMANQIIFLDDALEKKTKTIEELTVALGDTKAKLEVERMANETDKKMVNSKKKAGRTQAMLFLDNIQVALRFQELQLAQIRVTMEQKDALIAEQAALIEKPKRVDE